MNDDLLKLTVAEVRQLTSHITAFRLRHPDGAPLPAWQAGAHIKVGVEIGGKADWRHYSLIRTGADEHPAEYLIAVRREEGGRGGSLFMHQLKAGDSIQVGMPVDAFRLDPAHDDVLLIAGGIGITPLISMATALRQAGKRYALHYTGRSMDQLALVPELRADGADALSVYADDDSTCRLDLRALLAASKPSQALYTCGPKGMIDAVRDIALELGWQIDHIHYELFASAAPEAGDVAFEVELTQSGTRLQVGADQTILDAMIDAGLDPMFDCKRGECGVCAVPVLSGDIEHRDNCLTASERAAGNVIQICISRAKGSCLVLDA
ncbi:oxidoreductase [Massilia eurypsychrophila]|jgi:ferredoxin-NADP reductase|uniref:Oxidoreductase n=1 Tax=Massilia eurypsychrophila TaxID=1485217 RepID=A0A2G8TIB2_9BURK|nr:PDR/VanB family oxidoreductase [Massilia eurypsychrophila]PIL45760.1 oxidoreductase [Massilia eurypsychrophila]